ncbi:unnamed protein product, partial [Mesorhabditis spiculigera]
MPITFDSPELDQPLDGKLIQFINARVLKNGKFCDDHIWVRDGRIIPGSQVFFDEASLADIQVDCGGKILAPGFIDIQLNGAFNVDFSSFEAGEKSYLEGIAAVRKGLLAHGVTAFCPTVITSSTESYYKVLPLLPRTPGDKDGAAMLGAHMEGPFISFHKRGCHPPEQVKDLTEEYRLDLTRVYGGLDNIAIITIAPEKQHAEKAIDWLTKKGIVCSLGHSSAGWEEGVAGVKAGAKCITHLFNAMASYHHRDPGLIGLLTTQFKRRTEPLYYGIISDGIHTHDSALRLAYKTLPEGLILVTDAIAALGMGDGVHRLGQQSIIVKGHHAILEGTETTAGSVASMPYCIRHFVQAARCSIQEALTAATARPASLLSLANKGNLDVGADADLVLLDDNINILATFIAGKRVYHNTIIES